MVVGRWFAGLALLVFGRKAFWVFVGGIGFLGGIALAARFLRDQPDWMVLIAALLAGGFGALAAIFLQQLAVGLAGFLAGGYVLVQLVQWLGFDPGRWAWFVFLIGGLLGAGLVASAFEWSLIIISSLSGAMLLVQSFALRGPLQFALLGAFTLAGISIQAAALRRERRPV